MEISVIVPVYNEKRKVEDVLRALLDLPLSLDIILVNDGSTDGSKELLDELHLTLPFQLFHHTTNTGKGSAIRTGLLHARAPYTIIFDADMEYDPKDIIILYAYRSPHTTIYGSRYLHKEKVTQPFVPRYANIFLSVLMTYLFNPPSRLTDVETCLKLIPTHILKNMGLTRNDFTIEIEITGKLLHSHIPIHEVPVNYTYRTYAQGKKITWRDGWKAVIAIVRVRWGM